MCSILARKVVGIVPLDSDGHASLTFVPSDYAELVNGTQYVNSDHRYTATYSGDATLTASMPLGGACRENVCAQWRRPYHADRVPADGRGGNTVAACHRGFGNSADSRSRSQKPPRA